jgi:hypothetical protein
LCAIADERDKSPTDLFGEDDPIETSSSRSSMFSKGGSARAEASFENRPVPLGPIVGHFPVFGGKVTAGLDGNKETSITSGLCEKVCHLPYNARGIARRGTHCASRYRPCEDTSAKRPSGMRKAGSNFRLALVTLFRSKMRGFRLEGLSGTLRCLCLS